MSTIVFSEGIIAADTQCSAGDYSYSRQTKIFHACLQGQDFLGGCVGNSTMCTLFRSMFMQSSSLKKFLMDWRKCEERSAFKEMDKMSIDAFLTAGETGPLGTKFYFINNNGWPFIEEYARFIAIGSGAQFAFGALYMGATALDAVNAACKFDTSSSQPLEWMTFEGKIHRV